MNETEKNNFTLQNIKEKGTGLLVSAGSFLDNAIGIFKKDESTMTTEEKVEKQHMLNFIYGMGAGIVIYHFLIGAVLLLGIIWFYNLSLKKTKVLMDEAKPKKRTYKKRKSTKATTNESKES
ncbi:MAG TPA: hypothetical protein ENJ34_00810 [Epsilonproteobacteria bacterium]|nr:hypothetical protein [Campylobacterota bacterium]